MRLVPETELGRDDSRGHAARLGQAFGNGAVFWLNLQSQHDAWHAARKPEVGGQD